MQLHPAMVTTLISERERELRRRAERRRMQPRHDRPIRSAPWPP
jgi:hypothetical protein